MLVAIQFEMRLFVQQNLNSSKKEQKISLLFSSPLLFIILQNFKKRKKSKKSKWKKSSITNYNKREILKNKLARIPKMKKKYQRYKLWNVCMNFKKKIHYMNLEKKWKNFVEKIFVKFLTNSRFPLSKKNNAPIFRDSHLWPVFNWCNNLKILYNLYLSFFPLFQHFAR